MKLRTTFLVFFILLALLSGKAQIALTYYPFNNVFSVSSNTEKQVWADLRMETNTFYGNMAVEPHFMFNWKRTDRVNYHVGLGFNFSLFQEDSEADVFNGYSIDFGARIKPIQKHRNVQVVFELSPYINKYFDGGLFRALLGVAYNFGKKKD